MSIKDDVKKELSESEKMIASAFKLEALYKKYKYHLWGVAAALILFFGGQGVMDAMHQAKLEKANEAFLTLQSNSSDANALQVLKENNPALLELYTFSQAVQQEDVKALEALT